MNPHLISALAAHQSGDLEQALADYQRCLQDEPGQIDALHYSGLILLQQGQPQAGLAYLEQASQQAPEQADILFNLAVAYTQARQWPQALTTLQALIAQPETRLDADLLNQRAIVYFEMQQTHAAIQDWRSALAQAPGQAKLHFNLARALVREPAADSFVQAESHLQTALSLRPDYAQAWNSLGNLYLTRGQIAQAEQAYRRALSSQPDWPEPFNNLATALWEQGQFQMAYDTINRFVELQPDHAQARFNRGQMALQQGELQQGFRDSQARWVCQEAVRPLGNLNDRPLWQGETVNKLLIVCEQGFGDSLQFIRYLSWVQSQISDVYLECPTELQTLFTALPGITVIPEGQSLPETDAWCPLLHLPYLHGTCLESIPAEIPYLKRIPRRAAFESALQALPAQRPRIGVVWATGNRPEPQMQKLYQRKSLRAADFEALASRWPEFDFYSLQVGSDAEHLPAFKTLGAEIQDFADTAAYIMQMDLIISADTAVAHLAGGLGQPVYLLLPAIADWRWLLKRADSPWYPTMTLIRQAQAGDWESVLTELSAKLNQLSKK